MRISFQQKFFLAFVGIIFLAVLPLFIFLFFNINLLVEIGRPVLIASTAASICMALVLSYFMASRLSYPIQVMNRIAQKMARRDFSEKIKISTHDEHAELAHSLNEMSVEMKRHIQALSRTNAELEATLSSMQEGLLVANERGEILHLNDTGRKMFRIHSDPAYQTILETVRDVKIHDAIHDVLTSGRPKTAEFHFEGLTVLTNLSPLIQPSGRWGVVAVFHDVTELRRLERMRRDFVANVSHELKTPLTSIKGFAEILLDAKTKDAELIQKNLETIYRQAKQLEFLITDILDLAAIESGEIQMRKQPIHAAQLFKSVMADVEEKIKQRKLETSVYISDPPPTLNADERWLKQALVNLVANACNYTNSGGTIRLSAHHENKSSIVEIKDTGIGIAHEDLPRIFERFYRVDKARSRETGGTGLGLSIVKHIIEAHGGEISVESELGKGSTFRIKIPS